VTKNGTVRSRDGLAIELGATSGVRAVRLDGKVLSCAGCGGGFSARECVVPRGEMRDHGRFEGKTTRRGTKLIFEGSIPSAALELKAAFKGGDMIEVAGEVRDTSGLDRALDITFTLPLRLKGWTWENTAAVSRKIQGGKIYPSQKSDFLYLGIKGDGFADEIPDVLPIRTNKLPFSCVHKRGAGLALGFPISEPRVFLISADEAGYRITFSLGATPITRKFPSRASFRFLLYKVDPAWGIRSAAERYHARFRRMFRVRVNKHGHTICLGKDSKPDVDFKALGAAFQQNDYQWTNGEMPENVYEIVKKNDLTSFHWRGPWYWFHEAPGDITRDEQMALLKAQAEGRARGAHGKNNQLFGCPDAVSARGAYNSALVNGEGKLERVYFAYPQYSCWLLPVNMDPNLPEPNKATLARDWQYRFRKLWKKKSFRGPRGVAYDALDDFSGHRRLNFRRDHIEIMDIPPTYDPESGRICQVKGFGDWAWARRHGKLVRDDGGVIMANCNLEYAMMFCGPYLDVIFRERRVADNDEEKLSVHRMLLGGKPVCFAGGWRMPRGPKPWARMAERALLFGMAPGGGGNREGLRRIAPVLRKIGRAGWRPVPYARAGGCWVERFGAKPGRLYFTVRNTGKKARSATLSIDLAALGLAGTRGLVVRDAFEDRALAFKAGKGGLSGRLTVDPGRTRVLTVCSVKV